jgi:quercetin dioxygenase-like cupin family protein
MTRRTLHHPRTGGIITSGRTSAETGGALFEMSYGMAPHAAIADAHCHPHQEKTIRARSGTLSCTIDGAVKQMRAGDQGVVRPGAFHFQRNHSEEEAHAVEQYRPSPQMQAFFEVLIGWANDGKTNDAGLPRSIDRRIGAARRPPARGAR